MKGGLGLRAGVGLGCIKSYKEMRQAVWGGPEGRGRNASTGMVGEMSRGG